MIDPDAASRISGDIVVDTDGREVGQVLEVYVDSQTGLPAWAAIDTGLFGSQRTIIPLAQAEFMGNRLRIAYEKAVVEEAPTVAVEGGHLTSAEVAELSSYYGLATEDARHSQAIDAVPQDSPRTTSASMIRSAEQLQVSTEWLESERVRLRKVLVTEDVTVTVPITREEFRIEREPISGGNRGDAPEASPIPRVQHEVILYAQRPVVTTETVPVERIVVSTVTVTDQERVRESLREERIDVKTDSDADRGQRERGV